MVCSHAFRPKAGTPEPERKRGSQANNLGLWGQNGVDTWVLWRQQCRKTIKEGKRNGGMSKGNDLCELRSLNRFNNVGLAGASTSTKKTGRLKRKSPWDSRGLRNNRKPIVCAVAPKDATLESSTTEADTQRRRNNKKEAIKQGTRPSQRNIRGVSVSTFQT